MSRLLKTRRSIITGIIGVFTSLTAFGKATAGPTPQTAEGPFYPSRSMRFADIDNDLVKIAGMVKEAGGEVVLLKGVVTDDDVPQPGLRVEIWQVDNNGKYLHSGDTRNIPYDTGFQGFGHDITDDNGGFWFRTLKPTHYPGRTPHIHVKVIRDGREVLVSQLYIKDHRDNRADFLFNRMSVAQQQSVEMDFVTGPDGLEASVALVL